MASAPQDELEKFLASQGPNRLEEVDQSALSAILRDLEGIEGRLASVDTSGMVLPGFAKDLVTAGAQVLEGLRSCLEQETTTPVQDEDPVWRLAYLTVRRKSIEARTEAMSACGARLLHEARGRGAKSRHFAGEKGRPAEHLRDRIKLHLEGRGKRDPSLLARLVLEAARELDIFPCPTTMPELVADLGGKVVPPIDLKKWERGIRLALGDLRPTASPGDVSEAVVIACLKAADVQRPSAFFDRERKAQERAAGKNPRKNRQFRRPADKP